MHVQMNLAAKAANLATAPQQAEALVLNCMEYRLIAAVADYLDTRGLRGRYDQISLAGGALGIMSDKTAPWADAFWTHVALARKLHGIRRVIVIDHRDCRACKTLIDQDCAKHHEYEMAIHMKSMEAFADEIKTREPGLEVEVLLMDMDGSVTTMEP